MSEQTDTRSPANIDERKPEVKIFPNNYEAEKSFLCCMMIDEDAALLGRDQHTDLFYNARNRKIFSAMLALSRESKPVDIVTINDYLEKQKETELNILEYLHEINHYVPSAANYVEYHKILRRDMLLRRTIQVCREVIEEAYITDEAESTIDNAIQKLHEISATYQNGAVEHIKKASAALMARITQLSQDRSAFRGLPTGFPLFDRTTNGLQKGDLIILAARPSVGKTAFSLNILSNLVKNKEEVEKRVAVVFSLEMPAIQLAQRMYSTLSDVSMNELNHGIEANQSRYASLWDISIKLENSRIYVDDTSNQTAADISAKCKKIRDVVEGQIDLVIIDYLQLMQVDKDKRKRDSSKSTDVGEISRALKIMARELDCPVIVLSQMSRGIESREDKMPRLSDLRESGSIEQDADIVLFLTRENEEEKSKEFANIILSMAKHRNGELKNIRYEWEGAHVRFEEKDYADFDFIKKAKQYGAKAARNGEE